ncbi:MAG: OmpA family protein [Crocinitomicaceae bacterium]|nr:OmpA family protein [Crocinitomicaceae bacterium]
MRTNNLPSIVNSHTDTLGSTAYNDELAKRRLDAVLEILERNEDLDLIEGLETNVLGELEAMQSNNYRAENYRRVDIVYEIEQIEQEVVVDFPPEQIGVQTLTDSLVDFLKDSTQNEALIQLNVLFYGGSVAYLPESEPELRALFEFMKYNPEMKAHIRGHICCVGYVEWDDVSAGRANTVHNYLVNRAISPNRLTYQGYGTSMPFRTPEITEEDRKLNRRVDIIFTKVN